MRIMLIAHMPNNETTIRMFKENPKMMAERIEATVKAMNLQAAYFGEDE